MEDSDSFTPNINGCNSILCKYKVTRDGDDAISYNKALQSLQSTLRKDKYNGNGVAAQNDPLYKNLSRCIGYFDKNKERFPRQQDCLQKSYSTTHPSPKANPRPRPQPEKKYYNNSSRKPAPLNELTKVMTIVDKLKKYSKENHISTIYYMIMSIESVINELQQYNITTGKKVELRGFARLLSNILNRGRSIMELTADYRQNVKTLQYEMDEYIAVMKDNYKTGNKKAKEDSKKAKEDARRALSEERRAEEARRALSEENKKQKINKSRKSPPRASPRRNSSKKKRCPNGTRRNKKTGNCDPHNK
jgi:hypothetical protein